MSRNDIQLILYILKIKTTHHSWHVFHVKQGPLIPRVVRRILKIQEWTECRQLITASRTATKVLHKLLHPVTEEKKDSCIQCQGPRSHLGKLPSCRMSLWNPFCSHTQGKLGGAGWPRWVVTQASPLRHSARRHHGSPTLCQHATWALPMDHHVHTLTTFLPFFSYFLTLFP